MPYYRNDELIEIIRPISIEAAKKLSSMKEELIK